MNFYDYNEAQFNFSEIWKQYEENKRAGFTLVEQHGKGMLLRKVGKRIEFLEPDEVHHRFIKIRNQKHGKGGS